MNSLLKLSDESQKTMSSREIAELTNKDHRNVLRDVDKLNETYESMGLLKVEQGYYTLQSTGLQQHREFYLTKIQTLDLMTGYRADLRIKVNHRWAELESGQAQPLSVDKVSRKDLALMIIKAEEEKEKLALENKKQAEVIESQKPSVIFTNAVKGSDSSCLVGELAKLIKQNGYDIGEKRLFKFLRENGYLGSHGERYNIPNQRWAHLFELKKGVRSGNNGVMYTTITTKVNGEGQVYFINLFANKITKGIAV